MAATNVLSASTVSRMARAAKRNVAIVSAATVSGHGENSPVNAPFVDRHYGDVVGSLYQEGKQQQQRTTFFQRSQNILCITQVAFFSFVIAMSFRQNIHLDRNVEERVDMHWDFKPRAGSVANQRFAVLSIVCPHATNQKAEAFGIKIFGCFPTLEDANAYARELQGECNAFDYYTVETQSWAKLPPQVEKLDDQHFQEEELEKLKRSVVAMRQARAKMLEERMLADKAAAKEKEAITQAAAAEEEEDAEAAGS
jgi:hypothetical protein